MGNTRLPDPSTFVVLNTEKSFVHSSESQGTEVDIPDAIIDLFQADVFTAQGVGDADPMFIPSDPTVATDETNLEVSRVLERWQLSGESADGWSIDRSRRFLTKGLMGPFEVVLLAEGVEAPLLSLEIAGRRTRRLGLERSVHALVSTVLLRVGGFDELGVNPQTDPPDGESRETTQRGGRKGHPVVGPNNPRKTVLLEKPPEDRVRQADRGRGKAMTAEKEPAVTVDQGQRETIVTIAGSELSFEVGGPDIVGMEHRGEGLSRMSGEASSSTSCDEAMALENIVTGGARRPVPGRMPPGEHATQLFGSPGRMAASAFEQALDDVGRTLMRAGAGLPRTIFQPRRAFFPVTIEPLVSRLAADAEAPG